MQLKFKTPCQIDRVGSRETCNPPPTDTDLDFLVYVKPENQTSLFKEIEEKGYKCDTRFYIGTEFYSFRLDDINLIVTDVKEFHIKFKVATHLAKKFNLLDKQDRVALFQAILYHSY